jgi:O-antigen/teichoic acid export membrane protein
VYYLALGLANPMAFAATRVQTIVLAFPPQSKKDRRTLHFALAAGFVLGLLPLIFSLPGLIEFYYVKLQKLNPQDLQLVRWTAVSLIFFPFSVAIRAQSEGLAAWQKKPVTVLTGHALFLTTIVTTGFTLLQFGVPGHLIGPVGLTLGSLASSATMRIFLNWSKERDIPVGQTTTSVGQIR